MGQKGAQGDQPKGSEELQREVQDFVEASVMSDPHTADLVKRGLSSKDAEQQLVPFWRQGSRSSQPLLGDDGVDKLPTVGQRISEAIGTAPSPASVAER